MTDSPEKIVKTDTEWREALSAEQYRVAREAGTERAFSGEYTDTKTSGTYHCICCDAELFRSEAKFHSGCGWPSFVSPKDLETVIEHEDVSHGMRRVEVRCSRCEAHLGHVFPDGPEPTGQRYCINSVVLRLAADEN